ncbi:MAG: sulfatase family protein [Planctomycetota bacterium]
MYNQRQITRLFLLTLLISSLTTYATETKPNIILILCDDLGYGDVAGFGFEDSVAHTPNIDRLAEQGVRLTRFLVPMPYCSPSRASLMTGRYPYRTGVVYNPTPDRGIDDYGLAPSEITMAEVFQGIGYHTGCVGKWHLGHKPHLLPKRQGFDHYLGILYSNDMCPVQLVENEDVVAYPVVQAQLTQRYTQASIEFIRASAAASQPFFLYLAHAMPHKPLAASEDFYTPDTPDNLYEDVIRELDWSVGEIMKTLRQLGIDQNTLLIFTSDNGATYGGDNGGLRGRKHSSWDGGVRVPFIARWPGHLPAGNVNPSLASIVDIFPTLLRLAGANLPTNREIDGKNLWPLLMSEKAPSAHNFLITMHNDRLMTVHSGPWKLHVHAQKKYQPLQDLDTWKDPRGPDGVTIIAPFEQYTPASYPGLTSGPDPKPWQLFNVKNDPGEQKDMSTRHPEVVQRLRRYAESTMAEMPKFQRPHASPTYKRIKGGLLNFWESQN